MLIDRNDMAAVIACHACDLVHRRDAVVGNVRVHCVRCRAELYRTHGANIDTAIAIALSALILMLLSNAYPLVALQLNGSSRTTTLIGAARGLYGQGYGAIGALVLLTTVLIPLFEVLGLLYVLVPLRMRGRAPAQNAVFRTLMHLRPWAMTEVFMLGALVALVKLAAMAQVIPGIALFSYGGLMLTLSGLSSVTHPAQFWQWVDGHRA